MSKLRDFPNFEDVDPFNYLEEVALINEWEVERSEDGCISLHVEGLWQVYTLTLMQPTSSNRFRLVSTFQINPPNEKLGDFYKTLNLVNAKCDEGSFTYWSDKNLMVFRNDFDGGEIFEIKLANAKSFLLETVGICDRFYPAFQLTCWSNKTPEIAVGFSTEYFDGEA